MSTALAQQLLALPEPGKGRMSIACLLSVLLHASLLGFSWRLAAPLLHAEQELQITLVNSQSAQAPIAPQALAQHDLDGGGTSPSGIAATNLPFTDSAAAADLLLAELRQRQAQLEALQLELLSQLEASEAAAQAPENAPEAEQNNSGDDPVDQSSVVLGRRIAALQERIEQYNARPRQSFVAPATAAASHARYVEQWRRRIETIGTEHYPPEARGRIYGDLQITVYIRRDGQLERLEFDRPAREAVLNSAARRIIELASPFEPLPPEIAANTDILAITRTWHFTRAGLDTDLRAP